MKVVVRGYTSMPRNAALFKHFVAFKLHFVPCANHLALAYPQDEDLCGENCIYIRYSCLRKLHLTIVKRFQQCNHVMQFPPKSPILTKSVLSKRMKQLETYMNYVFSLNDDLPLQMYIRNWFVEYMNTSTYKNMVRSVIGEKKAHSNSDSDKTGDDSERKVIALLKAFNVFPMNLSEYLCAFEDSVSMLSKEGIYLLFFGNEQLKGLVNYIGQYERNCYGAVSCLLMVSKLIDCEYNVNYDLFRRILRLGSVSKIDTMHLEKLIAVNDSEVRKACFGLIRCLCEEEGSYSEEFWFTNDALHYEQYARWLRSN